MKWYPEGIGVPTPSLLRSAIRFHRGDGKNLNLYECEAYVHLFNYFMGITGRGGHMAPWVELRKKNRGIRATSGVLLPVVLEMKIMTDANHILILENDQ